MRTFKITALTTLIFIITTIISSCSVYFRHSNRTYSEVTGQGNSNSLTIAPPIFDPAGGTVKRGIGISILSVDGAQTYYNIGDGTQSDPMQGIDLLYDGSNKPIITHNTVIKARSFKTGYTPSAVVSYGYQLTPQIFAGGVFKTYGNRYNRIARVNADGTLDGSFDPGTGAIGPNDNIDTILIQNDGKILINGNFTSFNGSPRNGIARLNSDGSLDGSFNPDSIIETGSIALQSDGKILVAGYFTESADYPYAGIIRLNSNGTLDTSFNSDRYKNSNPSLMTSSIQIQNDGKILAIENYVSGGSPYGRVVRLNQDGIRDDTFAENEFNFYISLIALQSDGNVLVSGSFNTFNGNPCISILRLTSTGILDSSFNPGTGVGSGYIISITPLSNGKTFIAGFITNYNGTAVQGIAKLNSNGSLDNSFNPVLVRGTNGTPYVEFLIPQSDGKMIVAGWFTSYNGISSNGIARLNSDGSVDTSFTGSSIPSVGSTSLYMTAITQSDGKILLGGSFISYNPVRRSGTALLNMDGSLDNDFANDIGADDSVSSVIAQADGKVLIAGNFTHYNGTYRNRIARLNIDGTLDTSFNPGQGVSQYVASSITDLAIQKDGKILIGIQNAWGYNGTSFYGIVRLNTDGSVDNSFSVPINFYAINSIVIQNDNKILIGGTPLGTNSGKIVRLNTDGTLDSSFDSSSSSNGPINAIAVQADGRIIIGGCFNKYNNIAYGYLLRLNTDGSIDQSFNVDGSGIFFHQYVAAQISTITITKDGKIFIGGMFSYYNGEPRQSIAKLNSDGTLDTSFVPDTYSNSDGYDGICSILIQEDGKLMIGGYFSILNATGRAFLGRLNSDGSYDTSFTPNIRDGLDNAVFSIVLLSN